MSTRCALFTLVYDVLSRMHLPVCVQQDKVCRVNGCACIAHYSGTSEQWTLLVQRFLSFVEMSSLFQMSSNTLKY